MDQQYNKLTDEYNQSFTESGQARQKRALERYFNMTDKFRKVRITCLRVNFFFMAI